MTSISAADIESLCGRPAAFDRFATELLDTLPEHRRAETFDLRRRGRASFDHESKTIWWVWPWPPENDFDRPRSRNDTFDARLLQRLRSEHDNPRGELRMVLARSPRAPAQWAEQLASMLRARAGRPDLRVRVHGPDELVRWCSGAGAFTLDYLHMARALAARTYEYSACERALIAALDRRVDAREHWTVVADDLLRRGDPTGESLALALTSGGSSRRRELNKALVDREATRMLGADRHTRMLAFVDLHGRSFDVNSFLPALADPPEPDRYEVQLWAERVGPFFVRLLARTNYDEWRGLSVPEALLSAPELRYLSLARTSSIDSECADVSGRDLSGFDFSGLPATGGMVHAYEASLRDCDLRQADLSRWQLDGADLRDAEADLDTRFSHASFAEARVSLGLQRLLNSWNAGRYRHRRDHSRGTASVRDLVIAEHSAE
jgi:uncharacterized protein YjbI with pentapeptide repeats